MASQTFRLNRASSLATTSTLFLLMTWPWSRQWSPTAVGWELWLVWSFILVARVRPVSPTYRCWHCGHVILYTTPHLCRSGVLSLGCTNNERIVFMGRWYTPTSCARKILASFSDVPWMYGRPYNYVGFAPVRSLLVSGVGPGDLKCQPSTEIRDSTYPRSTMKFYRWHVIAVVWLSGHSALTIGAIAGRSLTK